MTEVKGEEYLVEHYAALGDLSLDFRNKNLYDLVGTLIQGQTVIDIGCGVGEFLNLLKSKGKSVRGVEPALGMRKLASQINPAIPVTESLDTQERVDTVVMLDVLEHVEDDTAQVRQIHTVLNPGGEFVFVVPAHQLLFGERDRKMGHYRRYSQEMLTELLTRNGFEIRSLRHWNALGFLPYLVSEKILKKPLNPSSRHKAGVVQRAFDLWFKKIENNFDFGFGLSIIGVAKKKS